MTGVTWKRVKRAMGKIRQAYSRVVDDATKIPDLQLLQENKVTGNTVKVLSQNLWCSYFAGGRHRTDRLSLFAEEVRDKKYDIICLQELFIFGFARQGTDLAHYKHLTNLLQEQGYAYHSNPFQSLPHNVGQNSGLCIYSKYPFDMAYFEGFRNRRSMSQKGFQHSTVALGNDELHLIHTHTEHSDAEMRRKQLVQMFNYMDRTFTTEKVVILGDFNTCQDTQEEQYNALQLLFDGYPNIFDNAGPSLRNDENAAAGVTHVDHVFTNVDQVPNSSVYVDLRDEESGMEVSDHLGLEFRVYVQPAPEEIPGSTKRHSSGAFSFENDWKMEEKAENIETP